MSVTIILQAPNTATITHTGAVSATITQSGAVSATIQQVVGQGVSVQNIVPNSVTINTGGASGGGTWGSITGTITDQTDLVTYVAAERQSYAIESPDGTSFIIVAGNDGTLAAIPPTSTAPSITTLPTISGTLNVGETLTAVAGTATGIPTPTRALQWQRSDNGTTGWADISSATGTTYLLGYNDEDKYIRVEQTEENILGTATANSASTGQIQPVVFSYLIDDYPNSKVAYSLRRLSSTYNGDAILVRRTSDNTTQSIGFNVNELDTASLESFCAGTDGFVTIWYDQSGNGNDAIQTIASRQAKIVNSGSVYLLNNKPIIEAHTDSTQDTYGINSVTSLTNNVSIFSTIRLKENESALLLSDDGSPPWVAYGLQGNTSVGTNVPSVTAYYNGTEFLSYTRDNFYQKTISQNILTLFTDFSQMNEFLQFGFSASISMYSMQEFVLYDNDQTSNQSDIELNINNYYSIY